MPHLRRWVSLGLDSITILVKLILSLCTPFVCPLYALCTPFVCPLNPLLRVGRQWVHIPNEYPISSSSQRFIFRCCPLFICSPLILMFSGFAYRGIHWMPLHAPVCCPSASLSKSIGLLLFYAMPPWLHFGR